MAREQARRLLEETAVELAAARQPLATYRLQLHKDFGFEAAANVLRYLADLGVTDLYTSPILQAAPGSVHGYDVIDHGSINAELGGAEGYEKMAAAVRDAGLGHVLDIVPNHMGLGSGNALWLDLLENGPAARAAKFFDVEWHPVKEELAGKVLVPVLGDRYGAVLERGEIQLELHEGAFRIRYYDHVFPVNPRSYGQILSHRIDVLEKELGQSEFLDELKSIVFVLQKMPSRNEQDPARQEERRREKEVAKRRVATLCAGSSAVRRHLEENVRIFNGTAGKPRSFDLLDGLLDAQAYRLAHWRVSSEEINYRRFFDINSLAAIRMEDPEVFETAHRIPLRLLAEGKINGLRVDHPDGLAYPRRYFGLLQEAHILQRAKARAEQRRISWETLQEAVREELRESEDPRLVRPLYVVAEKILGRTETLPGGWRVAGTTGYDFLNSLNGIFVARENAEKLDRIYARFIHGEIDFEELVYQKKKQVLYTAMASEMNLLARQLNRISEGNRWTRDFTLYALRSALIEVIACFPVYRSYIEDAEHVDDRDRNYILQAVACARRHNPAENASIYEFIADILLQKFAAYVAEAERPAQHAFALKLQQITRTGDGEGPGGYRLLRLQPAGLAQRGRRRAGALRQHAGVVPRGGQAPRRAVAALAARHRHARHQARRGHPGAHRRALRASGGVAEDGDRLRPPHRGASARGGRAHGSGSQRADAPPPDADRRLAGADRGAAGAARPAGAVHDQGGEGSEGQHQLDPGGSALGGRAPRLSGRPLRAAPAPSAVERLAAVRRAGGARSGCTTPSRRWC